MNHNGCLLEQVSGDLITLIQRTDVKHRDKECPSAIRESVREEITVADFETILRDLAPSRILDVATGRGDCLRWLREIYPEVEMIVGVDIDESTIEHARDSMNYKDVLFEVMDTSHLEFDDESFDLVAVCFSLHHFSDLEKSLEEMVRVIKPGGWLLVIEMYRDSPRETQQTHVLLHDWWADIDQAAGKPHYQTFTRQRILDILDDLMLIESQVFDNEGSDDGALDPERIAHITERCDMMLEKTKGTERHDILKKHGAELYERLRTVGYAPASQLIALLQKP